MLWVPPTYFNRHERAVTSISAPGTSITNNGVAHTKTSPWTQLIASTAFDSYLITVLAWDTGLSGGNSALMADVGIGASGQETVLIPDLLVGWCGALSGGIGTKHYTFPLYIPAGSRLSMRHQGARTSGTATYNILLWGDPSQPVWAGQHVVAYGINAATSKGQSVTAGNTTLGAWGQLAAATSEDHRAMVLGLGGLFSTTTMGLAVLRAELGFGPSTGEVGFGMMYAGITLDTEIVSFNADWGYVEEDIPSGTRICGRLGTSSGSLAWDMAAYGVS